VADSNITVPVSGGGTAVLDTRTESTNGENRQVVTVGDPAVNGQVAQVDVNNSLQVRDALGSGNLTAQSWTVTTAGTTSFLTASTTRTGLAIVSYATDRVYINWNGTGPTLALHSWFIDPDERYEVPAAFVQRALSLAGASGGGYLLITPAT
jgi:hypothetical protein